MSDTPTTEAPAGGAETPTAAATPDPGATTPDITAVVTADAAPAAEGEPKPSGNWQEVALKRETRLKHEARREADQLKAELQLLRAQQTPQEGDAPRPGAPLQPDAIRAEAEKLRQQERYDEARTGLIQTGIKELGREAWDKKTEVLAALGATDNPSFMEALVDLPDAQKLVVALADDPDRLQSLLAKRPTAMAAEMGRMVAELAVPKPRALSSVAAPVTPVSTRGTTTALDPAKMNAKEYIEYRNKTAPRHLGGPRRKTA